MRRWRYFVFIVLVLSLSVRGLTATQPISVRVMDMTETTGVAGVVLLISSVESPKARAYVTDPDGRVFVGQINGTICMVTALDPAGHFYDRTTEFDCHTSAITFILRLRPIIDRIDISDHAKLKIAIYGPDRKLLPKQSILFRPSIMTLETAGAFLETTDADGMIDAQLSPGEYTLATLIEGQPYETALLVTTRKQRCPRASHNCVSIKTAAQIAQPIAVHLGSAEDTLR